MRKKRIGPRGTKGIVSREISRASKKQRPETEHWKGLNAVLGKVKKKVHGPVPPPPYMDVSLTPPRSPGDKGLGRVVRKHGRG